MALAKLEAILAQPQFAVKHNNKLAFVAAWLGHEELDRMDGDTVAERNQQGANRTLAEKLDHLFATVRPSGRGEFMLDEVADAINQRGEVKLTAVYVSQLRRGQRTNPSKNILEALAWFFGVSPAYFFNDELAGKIEAELELVVAMRRASVQQIALRAADLSEESLRNLAVLIEHWRELERSGTGSGKASANEGD